ncbi:MAG: hypothetical protein ABIC95_00455 [archaeon]
MMADDEQPRDARRQVAVITSIDELMKGKYSTQEGWAPNFIELPRGDKASRVNLLGVLVDKEEGTDGRLLSATIDDGTGTMSLRTFDEVNPLAEHSVGSPVTVIGRPRVYGDQKYIMPEIVQRLKDPTWMQVRKLQLKLRELQAKNDIAGNPPASAEETASITTSPTPAQAPIDTEETNIEEISIDGGNDSETIIETIRKLDTGNGAETEEVIAQCGVANAEKGIEMMLKMGDIFEVAGKLKVLE